MLDTEGEVINFALYMWCNYIETGDCSMSAQDAKAQGEDKKVKALNANQMRLVVTLKDLAEEALKKNKKEI